MILTDYINKIKKMIKDDSGYLSEDDLNLCLENALAKLSKDWPLIIDIACNGNNGRDYDLPEEWVEGFSFIQAIEYPVGNIFPEYLEEEEFLIFQNNNVKKIRFLKNEILSTESYRMFFAVPYRITSEINNVPNPLSKAVIFLSSFLASEMLSAKYSQFQNSAMNSEFVNFNAQSEKLKKIGRDYYNAYENLIFNKMFDSPGNYESKAALVSKSCSTDLSGIKMFHI
jgi:hypothetical protein